MDKFKGDFFLNILTFLNPQRAARWRSDHGGSSGPLIRSYLLEEESTLRTHLQFLFTNTFIPYLITIWTDLFLLALFECFNVLTTQTHPQIFHVNNLQAENRQDVLMINRKRTQTSMCVNSMTVIAMQAILWAQSIISLIHTERRWDEKNDLI